MYFVLDGNDSSITNSVAELCECLIYILYLYYKNNKFKFNNMNIKLTLNDFGQTNDRVQNIIVL